MFICIVIAGLAHIRLNKTFAVLCVQKNAARCEQTNIIKPTASETTAKPKNFANKEDKKDRKSS